MKKKVFSLMMTLLLAFVGVARAEIVEIGDGGTSTNSYLPTYEFYNYSLSQQIYTADEIGTAGTINSIAFYTAGSTTRTLDVYMVHTTRTAFSGSTDWITPTAADKVFSGSVTWTANGWTTITLDTPFQYDGTNNLCLIVDDNTGSYVSSISKRVFTPGGNCAIRIYSDGTNYDALAPTSYSGTTMTMKNQIQLDIVGGGGAGSQLYLADLDGVEMGTLDLGVRPNGAWMEPYRFNIGNRGQLVSVSVLDFTPQDGTFEVVDVELPFTIARNEMEEVAVKTGTVEQSGIIDRQFVAIYGAGRTAEVWPIRVEIYDPATPDVWELACNEATTFPFVEWPATAHNTVLHNDYTLPFPEIPEGNDAVYKLVFANDVMLNAEVTNGNNGKVALYKEGFEGEGGPMADNYYQGPTAGGSGASAGFVAMIGDETSTTSLTYFPFHTLWNYSLAENLFLASELTEAGVTTAPMTSLSWYVSSTSCTTAQNNISIWMGNVSDAALTGTSHTTAGMTLVYTGNSVLPTEGWNEFEFNAGNFAWDGHSNVLILCQRQNGSWQGSVNWRTHNPGFAGTSYAYTDNAPGYDATTSTYSMSTSTTNRANIIMKSGNRNRDNAELTVHDGGTTNSYVPFYGLWVDDYTRSEMIYPAAELTSMNGGNINSLTFYKAATSTTSSWGAASFQVYLKEVTETALDSYIGMTGATVVYEGGIDAVGGEIPVTINFTTPYHYNGGNLLVGIYETYTGSYSSAYWYGENVTGASASGYNASDPANATFNQRNFLPKTTFSYTSGGAPTPGPTPGYNLAYGPVIENASVEAGTYYLVASSTDPDFEVTINAEPMPCPQVEGFAFGPTPADDEDGVEPGSVTLRWNIPAYATGWRLIFGTTYYPDPNHDQTVIYPEDGSFSTTLANSFTVRNLWNNTNYFWRVEFNNNGACPNGVSSPIWGFTTHLNIPNNLYAEDYTVFDDEQVVLHWNAVVDRTYRYYFIYRDGVKVGETTVNQIGETTFADGPLAYNMNGYTYYVTAVYDEGESAPSDPVTVRVSGYGDVNGHVYEQDGTTGIAGATVTMVGTDEFGVNHTYNFTTNGQGYYSGHIYAGIYNGQAACEGYQTMEEPVQGNPINMVYNQTTSPIDYILDENFDPVCSVLAEYFPDPEDNTSPYVKVSWGCGLPGEEILEPFETGDFSLFDWQLDPTYPWTITTTNPYEGQYCMKSGGAGVANVVSNMTVTVNIPADGLMSFFGKISCENNWDYGYFYIDGVQRAQFTGAGNWIEKQYEITEGEHTFMWQYTKDGSVNSNDDCFYVDYINFYKRPEPPVPGMTYNFEDNTMQGWTSVDADGDGYGWYMGSEIMTGQTGNNGSNDFVLSQSYYMGTVLYPDNYLVSPQVALGGIVTFYACAQDASYAAEHFGLAVSTTGTNPNNFTTVQEWTMTAKSVSDNGKPVKGSRSGRAQGNWYQYTVDLSAYAGQTGYVAIRHFNCSDMFYLNVDDITIGEPGKSVANNVRSLDHYRVYRTNCYNDGPYTLENTVLLSSVWVPDTVYIDVEWADLAPGVYKWGVGTVYSGNRGEEIAGPISWTEPVAVNNNAMGTRDELTYDFDNGMQNWTTIDADGDGLAWVSSMNPGIYHNSGVDLTGTGHNSSAHYVISGSYANGTGQALYPDNYLVSPQITLGGSISFYACAQDASYAAEHFGVAVSTTSGTSASAFTTIQEWTMTAKDASDVRTVGRDGNNRVQGNWYHYTVDLSAYSGMGYVAIRHFNCTDEFILNVDDITINTSGSVTPPTPPTPGTGGSELVNFEDGQLPASWINDATYPWVVASPAYAGYNGNYCMMSGNSGIASSTSAMEATVTFVENGSVSFLGGCWGEGTSTIWDKCQFFIDGAEQFSYGALQSWNTYSFDVAAGQHTFRWSYTKDSSVNPTGDAFFVDDITFTGVPGGATTGLQLPRESEIIWSNCLDKDMYLDHVTVNVLLNSADSPEGTTVDFMNYNEYEQQQYPISQLVLDESGFYAFDSFRRGDYKVTVTHEGYETIIDSVSIWEPTDLRYVMIEILYGVGDIYVSRTGWAMWGDGVTPGGGGGGGGQSGANSFTEEFEGSLNGWTVMTLNADGGEWIHSNNNLGGYDYTTHAHGGTGFAMCYSFVDYVGAYNTDSYLITPQKYDIVAGSTLSFWADNANDSYPENFSVCVATADNPTASDFTQVWSGGAKGGSNAKAEARHDANRYDNWRSHTIDLSAYAGQSVWIAFHDVNYDMYEIWIDDVVLTPGAKSEQQDRHFEYYKVMCTSIDGVPIYNHNTVWPFCQLSTDEPFNAPLVEGEHYLCKVAVMYSTGMSEWSEPVEWQYEPCDHWGPVDEVTVNTTSQGNHIEWVFDHGYNPYGGDTPGPGPQPGVGDWYYYDNGVNEDAIGTGGGNFWWGVMFPAGSYQGNMVTKVSAYDYMAMSGDVTIYVGGSSAPGTAVGQTNVTFTGSEQFVEFEFATPVTIDPTQNVWVVFYNGSGATYPAAVCSNTGNANGRWVSLDGATWEDLAGYGLDYTFMVRAYIASGAKGEVKEITVNTPVAQNYGKFAVSGNGSRGKGGQSFAKGGEFYNQYAEDGIMLNFFAIDNVDLRVYMLYKLSNDSRFSLIPEEEYGQFILTSMTNGDFMNEFETVYRNTLADFSLLSKVDIDDRISEWKTGVPSSSFTSVVMDVLLSNARVDNDHCINSLPFCTSEEITFEAASTSNTANEPNMDDGCIGSSYNPSFYHMRIHTAGPFVIHMEGHDPNTPTTTRDIDFCMWGPYTEQEVTSGTACSSLTGDKIMDCCYSAQYDEDCYLGYPEGQHNHHGSSTSHGSINYHVPEVGEYYILMITNYSQQPCVINFTKTEGEGETDCEIVTPSDIIGFLITQDGEYLAFAGPDDREYTDLDEYGDHEYCVRPIYPGTMILPDQNYGWSMGCPVCANPGGGFTCEPGEPIHGEVNGLNDEVTVWWGEQAPQPGVGDWYYYDDGVNQDAIGTGGGNFWWGVMFPAGSYTGNMVTKVAAYDYMAMTGTVTIYNDGANAPATPVGEMNVTMGGSEDFVEYEFAEPVIIDPTKNVWVVFYNGSGATYPAAVCNNTGDANGRWVSLDGAAWDDLAGYGLDYTFMIRAYIAQGAKGEPMEISIEQPAGNGGTLAVSGEGARMVRNRANIVKYNVYRSTDNVNYTLIGSVNYVEGQTYYEYVETPGAGNYYYQVRAYYSNDCESEPAPAYDYPTQDYVEVEVTGVGENGSEIAIYPNPTKGSVTIEAKDMNHITVVSVLGQVVYDAEVAGDNYILNMNQFGAGMYTVRVSTAEGVAVRRVTVIR